MSAPANASVFSRSLAHYFFGRETGVWEEASITVSASFATEQLAMDWAMASSSRSL
jgi:hypothetical protein